MKRKLGIVLGVILVVLSFRAWAGAADSFRCPALLYEVVATGAGAGCTHPHVASIHTVVIHFIDADSSVSAVTVDLEGSISGENISDADAKWFQLATHVLTGAELTAKQAMFHVANKAVKRVRANITVLTGEDGTNDKFTVLHDHQEE
jgi:hypothetical protein